MSGLLKKHAVVLSLCTLPTGAMAQAGFRYFDPADTAAAPRTLSATGLYANIAAKQMIPEAVRFDVNSPLWSDASHKLRWILLKKNASVTFREMDDYWDYPDSAVFVKQFAIDTVPGDTTTRVLWETRILINKKEHPAGDTAIPKADFWYGYSYKWRRNQADADLVSIADGSNDTIRVYPAGRGRPSAWKKWRFPSQHDCRRCHVPTLAARQSRSVLGFFTAQLNQKYWRGTGNQLDTLFARGVLKGTKADWARSPRWYGVSDSTSPGSTVDKRARAYIAANCSGCHGARGNANKASEWVAFNYDFHTGVAQDSLRFRPVRRGDMIPAVEPLDISPALVYPGLPQKSLILYRQAQRNGDAGDFTPDSRGEMPPLASYEPNQDAINLMARWIREMDTARVSVRPGLAHGSAAPLLQGRELTVPSEWAADPLVVTDIRGRAWRIAPSSPGRYRLPEGLRRGVYAMRIGGRSFLRQLL